MYFIRISEGGAETLAPVTVTRTYPDGSYDCGGPLAGGQRLREKLVDENGQAAAPADAAAACADLAAQGQAEALKAAAGRLDRLIAALMKAPGLEKIVREAVGNG